MRGKITWIVVADGQRATVYHNDGPNKGLQVIDGIGGHRDGARSHEMISDHAGRSQGFAGAHGASSMTPRTDPHEQEEARFTEHLAGEINHAALEKKFDRLILAAPPRTLGILRKALSSHATERVIAELDKDLTKNAPADIAAHVAEHLAV
ncbi:host attachment protein [Dongia sedimenti]|uniref:Host attachment protein n=1 Tax=Dongia sedimenti TaxID=3064282 RepID=A0ABU0YNB2_9PROT|nr:host attachment protein [Rhodospirillaceae bacterium R-7]